MKRSLVLIIAVLAVGAHPGLLRAQTLVLDYSTYLGGSGDDYGRAIAVDSANCAYVTGGIKSFDFPTENPYQAGLVGLEDAFVSKFSPGGSSLVYSTYLGGSATDKGWGIAIDSSHAAYVAGTTSYSNNFPTVSPYQASYAGGAYDTFVSKLSSSGSALIYSTYLGGDDSDMGRSLALDSDNYAYISGNTTSTDFPTLNPYQAGPAGGTDGFVSKLSSTGSSLVYSTYLGGSDTDIAWSITADSANSAYVTGYTSSTDFPTENPYQAGLAGFRDVFVSKLSSTGTSLIYSTYLGGSIDNRGYGIALDTANSAYVAGMTISSDFPTVNPYQAGPAGGTDGFVSALSSTGSSLLYSTYLGGSASDYGYGIALDSANSAYVTGYSSSTNFPTENSYQASFAEGTEDAFVSALSSSGSLLIYSTYLGGSADERGYGIAVDSTDNAYVTGYTNSSDFPTANPYQPGIAGSSDAFVFKLNFITPAEAPPWIYDYNGDGTSDIAIFRSASGLWAVRSVTRVYFGGLQDEPVPGDYDGDRTTDIGIFRPASGLWALRSVSRIYFGGAADETVPGDYDGGGTWSVGIFRPTSGLWAVRGTTRIYFGGSADIPVPGYYDGAGAKEIGIFRESSGLWALRGISLIYFGTSGDETVPGDYDGNGTWDVGIFRGSSGLWALRGTTRIYFGSSPDQPVPADYVGNSVDDVGIFRETSGLWAVRGVTRVYFGAGDDLPVTR